MAPDGLGIEVFPVTGAGYGLAKRLALKLGATVVHSPSELKGGGLRKMVREAFEKKSGMLFVSASGIAVRAVAPHLKGKHIDPAVLVMDEKGRFVISLVSGHLGGANGLAKKIAALMKATPVITTATDISGLPCVEDIAGRFSLRIEDVKKIKLVNSSILKGCKIAVIDANAKRLKDIKKEFSSCGVFSFSGSFPQGKDSFSAFIFISPEVAGVPPEIRRKTMALRPREIIIGIGCRRGTGSIEIKEAVEGVLSEAGLSPLSVRKLSTIDIKNDEAGLLSYAKRAGLEIDFFDAGRLNTAAPPSGESRFALKYTGAGGVCENAALISSGAERLCIRKRIWGRVTVAAAFARYPS